MNELISIWLSGLTAMLAIGVAGWLLSLKLKNVAIVDSLWSLMFLAAAAVYVAGVENFELRALFIVALVTIWALRLSGFLTLRNWGEPEDRRYREIRKNNQPHFNIKSLYIVFGLQAVLAWIISVPLLISVSQPVTFNLIDLVAVLIWLTGFVFESVADYQLYRFKADADNKGKVLDTGLWRYSRHPNYFGESLIWLGFYLFAVSAGGWWTVFAPVVMTLLLLKVSGVALMEKDISQRREKYRDYIESTNAFIPGKPKSTTAHNVQGQKA